MSAMFTNNYPYVKRLRELHSIIMPKSRTNEQLIVHSSSSTYVVFTTLVLVILLELQLSEISVKEICYINSNWQITVRPIFAMYKLRKI